MKHTRTAVKHALDVLMTLMLLFQMGYQLWGDVAHEWVGAGMFALFIAHHVLNFGWYKSLFRGKYSAMRAVQVIVNTLLLLSMLGLMVSGVMLSRHVFAFLPIESGMSLARLLHMVSSYWSFVLMALHLGLHWGMVVQMFRRAGKITAPSKARSVAVNAVSVLLAGYGVYAFIQRGLSTYMLLQTEFVFLDFGEPPVLFYIDYLAILALFVFIAYTVQRLLRRVKSTETKGAAK